MCSTNIKLEKEMKFLKNNLKIIIGFILGIILFAGIGVYATYNYFANEIGYKKADGTIISVGKALNELYGKSSFINGDENAREIISLLGSIDTNMNELLSDPFWFNRLIENDDTFNYICNNSSYMQYVFNSANGMSKLATSSFAINKAFKDYYSSFINSPYLSLVDQYAIKVPTMTSNSTPSGVALATTESMSAFYAFDKKSDSSSARSAWVATKYNTGYIQYMFDKPNRIYKFTLENLMDGSSNYVTSFTLQGSNDGSNFNNIYSGTNGSGNNTCRTFLIPTLQNRYKYYRIVVNEKGGNWTGFGEINFYCFDIE